MTRSKSVKTASSEDEPTKSVRCEREPRMSPEDDPRVKAAVQESLRFFMEVNRENIRRSSKEHIAVASYCGGMMDMVMVIRNVLGIWGVDQLMTELERFNSRRSSGSAPEIRITIPGGTAQGGMKPEDAKELGEQIARWIGERSNGTKKQAKDPMFA